MHLVPWAGEGLGARADTGGGDGEDSFIDAARGEGKRSAADAYEGETWHRLAWTNLQNPTSCSLLEVIGVVQRWPCELCDTFSDVRLAQRRELSGKACTAWPWS